MNQITPRKNQKKTLQPGTIVWLKNTATRTTDVKDNKFFTGPYKVVKRLHYNTYEIKELQRNQEENSKTI